MDRRTDQQAYFPIEMEFYISAMFLGFPDQIHKQKPSFLDASSHVYMSVCPSVRRMVGRMIYFFGLLEATHAVYTA